MFLAIRAVDGDLPSLTKVSLERWVLSLSSKPTPRHSGVTPSDSSDCDCPHRSYLVTSSPSCECHSKITKNAFFFKFLPVETLESNLLFLHKQKEKLKLEADQKSFELMVCVPLHAHPPGSPGLSHLSLSPYIFYLLIRDDILFSFPLCPSHVASLGLSTSRFGSPLSVLPAFPVQNPVCVTLQR